MKWKLVNLFIFLLSVTLFTSQSYAEFYKYIDKKGVIHFVDSISKIPVEFRNNTISFENKQHDPLSKNEREKLLEREEMLRLNMIEKFASKEVETKIIILNNNILVPAKLGYRGQEIEALLLLDTGASITLLDREKARKLGIRSFVKTKGQVADGKLIETALAKLDYITVGPFKKMNIHAAFIDRQGPSAIHDGLLGMNFLRNLEYSIDFERSVIKWKKS
jgi:clan AA aspartic protease (TIGR02281 family)